MNRQDMVALLASAPANLRVVKPLQMSGRSENAGYIYGLGAVLTLAGCLAKLEAGTDVFIVGDPVLQRLGTIAMVEDLLTDAGFRVAGHYSVEPEPSLATIETVEAAARAFGARIIIGIGGGSAMDVAKSVALPLGTGATARQYLSKPPVRFPGQRGLPLVLIPTTAGTGSEVSIYAVASEDKEKRWLVTETIVPDLAIVDPLLTVSMPPLVTAATGLDALTHAIEAMMHTAATPMCEALSFGAIELIARSLPKAVADGSDLQARYDMAIAASMAMMSFNQSGALWAHSVSYVLGAHMNTPHGIGCALGLPYLMDFNRNAVPDLMQRLAAVLGPEEGDAAGKVLRLMRTVGLPLSLAEYGVARADLPHLASEMVDLYPRPANPAPMPRQDALTYWQRMHEGLPL